MGCRVTFLIILLMFIFKNSYIAASTSALEYMGCFQDQPNRTLTGKYTLTTSMTVETCKDICTKENNKFYGVQYSHQCFCGDFLTTNIPRQEKECNMKCSGNKNQMCGGIYRMNIYRNPNYNQEHLKYMGCFQDQTNRTLTGKYTMTTSMTVETCKDICTKENNQFYGVQYSHQCFCGDFLTTNIPRQEKECNMPCSGNKNQMCGGIYRMNIYRNPNYNQEHLKYMGCFQDQTNRTLTGKYTMTTSMTVETCKDICAKENNQFYGVQYSHQCFCGDFLTTNIPRQEKECNMPCSGNKNQLCGGIYRMNIYRNPNYNQEHLKYMGCFQDQPNRTLTGKYTMTTSMTIETCKNICTKENNKFYGVQYSHQCFCGDFLSTNISRPETECNMKCSGNNNQMCGGIYRMNIYRNPNYNQ